VLYEFGWGSYWWLALGNSGPMLFTDVARIFLTSSNQQVITTQALQRAWQATILQSLADHTKRTLAYNSFIGIAWSLT
jgi:hypothetical protein